MVVTISSTSSLENPSNMIMLRRPRKKKTFCIKPTPSTTIHVPHQDDLTRTPSLNDQSSLSNQDRAFLRRFRSCSSPSPSCTVNTPQSPGVRDTLPRLAKAWSQPHITATQNQTYSKKRETFKTQMFKS